jgi:hypothetical protein
MIGAGAFNTLTLAMVGCRNVAPPPTQTVTVSSSWPALTIPADVQRIAVFYPQSSDWEFSEAYHRLEGAVFQLKAYRSKLTIVDRVNLPTVIRELRFQIGGDVTDNHALHLGHILGVDSVLIYSIEGPALRERFMARRLSLVRPITITTKIIRVESAEVIYHDVVVATMEDTGYGERWLFDNNEYPQLSREALERSIKQTVVDLQRAFQ